MHLMVKIRDDGKVAIVHDVGNNPEVKPRMMPRVSEASKTWIRVSWQEGNFPAPRNDCRGICRRAADDSCLCPVTVSETRSSRECRRLERFKASLYRKHAYRNI